MLIVLDGYNILKTVFIRDRISESEMRAFIALLGRYIHKRHKKVYVMLDAGPCTYPMVQKQHGVEIHYSGEYQTADDSIMIFVKEHSTKQILVVTKDREIKDYVLQFKHVHTADPKEFYARVQEILNPPTMHYEDVQVVKLSEESNEELDALMREASGMDMPEKDEMYQQLVRVKKQKVSKKDKKRKRSIDKL